ncbi:Hypothetical protein SMAX5B_004411 [Scophthalmus maximus]|uniref:Uncharacterized protein n=1 Tax=Scophthalmus maximus TaxID=52904 RepID=A0A2U9BAG3_SCOMX|nr:Hypothetical protein SMAX5B_004411 [Scophthalmus maximus]
MRYRAYTSSYKKAYLGKNTYSHTRKAKVMQRYLDHNSICLAVTSHDQCGVLQPAQRPFFNCPRTTRSTTTHVFLCPLVVNVSQCACASQTRKRPEKTNSPLQVLMSLAPLRAVVRIPRRRERSTR